MNAEEFPALLRGLTIPGATVKPANGKPGSGLELGFIVTGQHGARIAWQVALRKHGGLPTEGPPAAYPEAIQIEPDRLVCRDVEASIANWIGLSAAGPDIKKIVRYSEIRKAGIRYGLRLDLHDGGQVFIQALWILEPGEEPNGDNKFRMHDSV